MSPTDISAVEKIGDHCGFGTVVAIHKRPV